MNRSLKRVLSAGTVVVLAGTMASSAAPVSGATIRTDTSLGGYSVKTNAAPVKVLIDDPASAIPHEPGSAILEVDPAYTAVTLESGPNARALASALWPGTLLGDGIGAATGGQLPGYPVKADARYPDKPYTATAQGCIPNAGCLSDNGMFMSSQALGLDVKATAKGNPADVPGSVDLGTAYSTSTATVKDGVAIGTSESKVTDITLLSNVIKIGSVSTTVTVRGDGKKATSSGSTVVSGLTVGGVGYVVDDKGARPVGTPVSQGTGALPLGLADPAKALGITISGTSQEHSQDASTATRDAKGLRITIDTVVLRGVLDSVTPSPLRDALYGLFSQVPNIGGQNVQGYLFYLLTTTPKITYVIGAGGGVAAASLPLSFDFPDLPPPGLPPVVGGATTPGLPASGGSLPTGTVAPPAPGPVVAGPTTPVLSKAASKDPFGGLSPGLLLLVLALAGVAGWGLVRVQSACFGGVLGSCTSASRPTLPDLRGE
jgi:hypothetical protein